MPYNKPSRGGAGTSKGLSVASNHSVALLVLAALAVAVGGWAWAGSLSPPIMAARALAGWMPR